jgi:three-Cys-motif partner protein
LEKYYIDAFTGAGVHLSKETGQQIEGSPARALRVRPPFDRFYFIDMNPEKTAYLKTLCEGSEGCRYHHRRRLILSDEKPPTDDPI